MTELEKALSGEQFDRRATDIPENMIAVGNPCRVLREVIEADKLLK